MNRHERQAFKLRIPAVAAGILLLIISTSSQATISTTCASPTSCTLAELFAGGVIQIDDIEFSNFRADVAIGDVAAFSSITVTPDDTDPLNVGLKFSAAPIVGNINPSFFDFNYSVTALSAAISLTDASLELTSGTALFSIDEDLSDAIDSINPEFASLTVFDTTPALKDVAVYAPTDFLYVENFLAVESGGDIADFEQYFSLTPVGTGPFQQDANGLLSMEAENFTGSGPGTGPGPFVVVARPLASELEGIQSDPTGATNTSPVDAPFTSYDAEFVVDGPHYVWLRGRGFETNSNSLYVDLGGQGEQRMDFVTDGEWHWLRADLTFNVAAPGPQTLTIYRRNKLVEVDKIVITSEFDFDPGLLNDELGPDESARAGGGNIVNTAPALDPIPDATVLEGTTQTISIMASDIDVADTLTITFAGLPTLTSGSISVNITGNGMADLVISPDAGDAVGSFVTVTVTDDGVPLLSDSKTFLLNIVAPNAGAFIQTGQVVSIEAESFDTNVAAGGTDEWEFIDPLPDASNTKAMKASPGSRANGGVGSFMTYEVQLEAGQQRVWFRPRSFSSNTDSFYFQFNGGSITRVNVGPDNGQWHWQQLGNLINVNTPGVYTITIYRREKATELDKLVMTTLSNFDPQSINSGLGPNESLRAGGAANEPPELDAIGLQTLDEGESLPLNFSATDPDLNTLTMTADPTSLFTSDVAFNDDGGGTASWTLNPTTGDAGDYSVTVTVTDDGVPPLSDEETFTVRVLDPVATGGFIQDASTGMLVAEAENYTDSDANGGVAWALLDPSADASNNKAIKAASGPRTNTGGADAYTEYAGEYTITGTMQVWARIRTFSGNTDSFFVQMDSGPITRWNLGPDDGQWHWIRLPNPIALGTTGEHILRFFRREPNVEFDKVIVTPDAAFTPPANDVGPPESPRSSPP